MTTAFTVGILLISAIVVLVPTLLGIKRGTVKAGIKLVSAILAAIIAFIICRVTMPRMGSMFFWLLSIIAGSNETLASIVDTLETGTMLMTVAVGLIATVIMPFIFVILYLIIKAIIGLVASIALKLLAGREGGSDGIINLGWAIGFIYGVFSLVILAMPIIGLLNLISPFTAIESQTNEVISFVGDGDYTQKVEISIGENQSGILIGEINGSLVQIQGDASSSLITDIYPERQSENYVGEICNSFPVKVISAIGAKPLFRSLTTFKVNGEKVSLLDEVQPFAQCYNHLKPLTSTEMKNYSVKQAIAVRRLSNDIQNSDIAMLLFGEILPEAAENWLDDEAFMGVKPPSVGKELEPLMDQLLGVMTEIDKDTVKEDVSSMFEVAAIVFEHETLKYADDEDALLENITTKGYISQLMSQIDSNERLKPLSKEITDLGVRSVGTTIEIPDENDPLYVDMVNDVVNMISKTSSIKNKEERHKMLSQEIEHSLEKAGVETTQDEREIIAHYLIDHYADRSDVSFDEIDELFKEITSGS